MKICCIVIDTGTTRNDLDSASRRYWERLSSDLRAEVSSRLMAVIDFLSTSSRDLDRKPRSVEEIGSAYETYTRIKTDSVEVEKELELVTGLAKILAAWTRDKLEGNSSKNSVPKVLTDFVCFLRDKRGSQQLGKFVGTAGEASDRDVTSDGRRQGELASQGSRASRREGPLGGEMGIQARNRYSRLDRFDEGTLGDDQRTEIIFESRLCPTWT